MSYDVDGMLEHIGGLGLYQIRLVLILAYLVAFSGNWMTLIVSFTAAEPPWQCVNTSSSCNVTGLFKVGHEHYALRCSLPRNEWKFVDSFSSIVTEWDLVCDKSILASVASSMVFAGWLVGCLVCGWFSDRYGRKLVMFVTTTIACLGGLISAFAPSLWLYIVCRFISGFGVGGSLLPQYILSTELTGIKYRGSVGTAYIAFWYLGFGLIPLFAWLLPEWRDFSIALSIPALPCFILWKFIPESPRWLLIEDRKEDAKKVLQEVARMNGKTMPKEELCLTVSKSEESENGNILDLFRTWSVAKVTLVMFLAWLAVAMQSYGTTFFSVTMAGNMYINFFLASVSGIPSNIYTMWAINRFGRKKSMLVGLLIPTCSLIIMIFLPVGTENTGINVIRIIFFLSVKFFNFSAFSVAYVLSAEVFPTMTRSVGMGACSAMARIGAFIAPLIVWLQRVHLALPMTIMSGFTLTAALMTLALPETHMKPTLETVMELKQDKEKNINEESGIYY